MGKKQQSSLSAKLLTLQQRVIDSEAKIYIFDRRNLVDEHGKLNVTKNLVEQLRYISKYQVLAIVSDDSFNDDPFIKALQKKGIEFYDELYFTDPIVLL